MTSIDKVFWFFMKCFFQPIENTCGAKGTFQLASYIQKVIQIFSENKDRLKGQSKIFECFMQTYHIQFETPSAL